MTWHDRIIGQDTVDPDQLLANPYNWRIHPQHQQQALLTVLDKIGWVRRVLVNQVTGHVIDGHLRAALAITRGEQVPVDYVALTPEEERLALLTLDSIAAMAVTDSTLLDDLITQTRDDYRPMPDSDFDHLLTQIDPLMESTQAAQPYRLTLVFTTRDHFERAIQVLSCNDHTGHRADHAYTFRGDPYLAHWAISS